MSQNEKKVTSTYSKYLSDHKSLILISALETREKLVLEGMQTLLSNRRFAPSVYNIEAVVCLRPAKRVATNKLRCTLEINASLERIKQLSKMKHLYLSRKMMKDKYETPKAKRSKKKTKLLHKKI